MRKASGLLLLLCAADVMAARFDPPDLSYEMKLHQQFLHLQNQDHSAMSGSRVENYRIQSGESLWSLSHMLYGDGNYWPRVWAQNQKIANPHLIREGHNLQFLMGSEDEAPAFRISEEDEGGLELAAATQNQSLIEIPPPEIPPRPVGKLPGSFPMWQSVFKPRMEVGGLDDRALGREREKIPERIFLTAFVQDGEMDSIGQFLEVDQQSLPVSNQYIYVKVKKGLGQPGMKMLIARDTGRIKKVNKIADYPKDTHLIQVGGEIQLSETMPANFKKSRDRDNFDVFRALITRAIDLSTWQYGLMSGELTSIELSGAGPSAVANAQIIGAAKHQASALYGPGEIVFLNKGSSSGIEVGQLMDVFEDRTTRRATPVQYSPVPSARIKIAQVSSNLATAVIIASRNGIQQGDLAQEVSARADAEVIEFKGDESDVEEDIQFEEGSDESDVEGDLDAEEGDDVEAL